MIIMVCMAIYAVLVQSIATIGDNDGCYLGLCGLHSTSGFCAL